MNNAQYHQSSETCTERTEARMAKITRVTILNFGGVVVGAHKLLLGM